MKLLHTLLILASLLLALSSHAQRTLPALERPDKGELTRKTERIEDIDTRGKTEKQIETERRAKFKVAETTEARKLWRDGLKEDLEEDEARPVKRLPGHRPGRYLRLTWADTTAFERWQTRFSGVRKIGDGSDAFTIGPVNYETPATYDKRGNELTAATGRRWTQTKVTHLQIEALIANGVTVTRAGSFTDSWKAEEIEP